MSGTGSGGGTAGERDEARERVTFSSASGADTIVGYVWWTRPEVMPRGVVQLVHGMCEHITRYDAFARHLTANGYVVCGHDQVGHGETAGADGLGDMPAKDGVSVLVGDIAGMRSLMLERLRQAGVDPTLPYFIFGHSMGSFELRTYLGRRVEAAGLAGAIICGTGHVAPALSRAGNLLARMDVARHGTAHCSKLITSLADGAYIKQVDNPRTPNDWLSYDEANVDAFRADPLCGFPFGSGGYATLTAMTGEVCTKAWARSLPKELPLLLVAGKDDPVGDMGEGVRTTERLVRQAGVTDVTCTIYEHMRHEILNEQGKERVFDDVVTWLGARASARRGKGER